MNYKIIFFTMTDYKQLSPDRKEITWYDDRVSIYKPLTTEDYAIIRGSSNPKSVFIGKIEKNEIITTNESSRKSKLTIKILNEFKVNGDRLLCIHAIAPEFQSQMKAHFTPYIAENTIDIHQVGNAFKNEEYINFYIIDSNHERYKSLLDSKFKTNDRVIVYNKGFDSFHIAKDFNQIAPHPQDAFSCKGKTLEELIQLFALKTKAGKQKSKNISVIQDIIQSLKNEGLYKFKSFAYYWNIIHNKSMGELFTDDEDNMNDDIPVVSAMNTILYGPPGTGKTYTTIERAIAIANPDFVYPTEPKSSEGRKVVRAEYERILKSGQIMFTTFHQSMSYEDFIEGIKPIEPLKDGDPVIYRVTDGIFKEIVLRANSTPVITKDAKLTDIDKRDIYKISLGGIHRADIHDWCLSNGYAALGWGNDNDLSELSKIKDWKEYRDKYLEKYGNSLDSKYEIQATYIFCRMQIGDIIMASKGLGIIDAVGIIESEYELKNDPSLPFSQYRKVNWFKKNLMMPAEYFVKKNLSQQSIYEFDKDDIIYENIVEYEASEERNTKNYVLIIDEINRGNISQIFGELITLIEEDKRSGKPESLEVTLPYSKKTFMVPPNLYIIGTMNTADRSVEALDTALRRRFSFIEMMPDYSVLETIEDIEGISISKLLQTINERLKYLLDRDHQIGHSYFLKIKDKEVKIDALKEVFVNNIIPLLKEYFYNDYQKIGAVLSADFIRPIRNPFPQNSEYHNDERDVFEIVDLNSIEFVTAVRNITGA